MKSKDKKIIQDNILIAEFMGGKPVNAVKDNPIAYSFPFEFGHQETWDEGGFQGSGASSSWDIEDLQYHSSWDWIMPVYLKAKEEIKTKMIRFRYDNTGYLAVFESGKLILEGKCFEASQKLTEAIKWHNETKDKK